MHNSGLVRFFFCTSTTSNSLVWFGCASGRTDERRAKPCDRKPFDSLTKFIYRMFTMNELLTLHHIPFHYILFLFCIFVVNIVQCIDYAANEAAPIWIQKKRWVFICILIPSMINHRKWFGFSHSDNSKSCCYQFDQHELHFFFFCGMKTRVR